MTIKTSVAGTPDEATSMAPKIPNNPNATTRVKPVTDAPPPKRPVFVIQSLKSINAELRANIHEKWEACWPINMLRPLVLLDLMSYLLFIKKIEEKQLSTGEDSDGKEKNELSWSTIKELDAQSLHELFTKERGLPDLVKSYSNSNLPYSLFLKEPLLLVPTGKLLINMLAIIKIMDAEDSDTKAAIFEYLLNKAEIVGHNGQVFAPDYAVKLMVSLMQPGPEDIIGDPSAGNGSFFVNSAKYIAYKNPDGVSNSKNDAVPNIYKGIESDLIQLRIGAMNMILHGIENPKIEVLNVFSKTNINLREQPTLILSNLFFESTEEKAANGVPAETRKPEIRFLDLILKGLKSGGRSAVILREAILYDNKPEIKTIRRHIVDEHKLEAVIALHGKNGSVFSNASILIFSKPETAFTDKVWFYKMEVKEGLPKKNADSINTTKNEELDYTDEYNGVQDILSRWKNETEETARLRSDKSFYVPADEIKAKNYNLAFNEYRSMVTEPELYNIPRSVLPAREIVAIPGKEDIAVNAMPKEVDIAPAKAGNSVEKTPVTTPAKDPEIAPQGPVNTVSSKAIDNPPPKETDNIPNKEAVIIPAKATEIIISKAVAVKPEMETVNPAKVKIDTTPPPPAQQAAIKVADISATVVNDNTTGKVVADEPLLTTEPLAVEAGDTAQEKTVVKNPEKIIDTPLSRVIPITTQKIADKSPYNDPDYFEGITFSSKKPITPFLKRRPTIVVGSLVVVCVIIGIGFFKPFTTKNAGTAMPTTVNAAASAEKKPGQTTASDPSADASKSGMLSSAQIKAILKDTAGILHFPGQVANVTGKKDITKKLDKSGTANILIAKKSEAVAAASVLNVKYAVTDTTFFHDEPDPKTRRKSYLDPLNKNILKPKDDRNGYIYIEYTNRFGRTSKGWINKKDLKLVR
ncbi:MAG: N-6 DNA methylase [Ginsengibacter sp.]